MKTNLKNLTINSFQLILNQSLAFGIFYFLSTGLDKNSFGEVNFALAILLIVFNILSFGMDQLLVKKIASGEDTSKLLSVFFFHVLLVGLLFYVVALPGSCLLKNTKHLYILILMIGFGKLMVFFSTPFKQCVIGLEKFHLLACMLVVSNIIRFVGLGFLTIFNQFNLNNIIVIFICGDVLELVFSIYIFRYVVKIKLNYKWCFADYKLLLNESLPQTGVVLITSALARFDWIFIGIFLSASKLAEYSFAYKIFEISTLPLLAVAPILIPMFTKIFKQENFIPLKLNYLVKIEMMVAAFTLLILNIVWTPTVDLITAGKYGTTNIYTIFILSLSIPFIYLNNFFWTINFAKGRYKMILTSFIITIIVNIGAVVLLIPMVKNEGAAIAFLLSCSVQFFYYQYQTTITGLNKTWIPLFVCLSCAIISCLSAKTISHHIAVIIPLSIVIYIGLLFLTQQLKLKNIREMLHFNNLNNEVI